MHQRAVISPLALVAASLVTGCDAAQTGAEQAFRPEYRGVDTQLLQDDMVNFIVRMDGARSEADVTAYAECAAAQYALIRGYGFARQVRTTVTQDNAGLATGDAVYLISPALPRGLRTIDAEVVVAACKENGIPTV